MKVRLVFGDDIHVTPVPDRFLDLLKDLDSLGAVNVSAGEKTESAVGWPEAVASLRRTRDILSDIVVSNVSKLSHIEAIGDRIDRLIAENSITLQSVIDA